MSVSLGSARRRRLRALLAAALAALVAVGVNLALYGLGRAAGGDFTYVQSGHRSTVDALSVIIMSVGPLLVGLALVAGLTPRWPGLIGPARIAVPVLALATIAFMTVPAHFDATSTIFLSGMHIAIIPISLFAIAVLQRNTVVCDVRSSNR